MKLIVDRDGLGNPRVTLTAKRGFIDVLFKQDAPDENKPGYPSCRKKLEIFYGLVKNVFQLDKFALAVIEEEGQLLFITAIDIFWSPYKKMSGDSFI